MSSLEPQERWLEDCSHEPCCADQRDCLALQRDDSYIDAEDTRREEEDRW